MIGIGVGIEFTPLSRPVSYGGSSLSDPSITVSASNFGPLSISGCLLLFKASTGIHLVSGKVSQWDDLSGNNNHATQSTSANRGTISSNSINGRDAFLCDSTAATGFFVDTPAIGALSAFTAFVVTKESSFTQAVEYPVGFEVGDFVAMGYLGPGGGPNGQGILVDDATNTPTTNNQASAGSPNVLYCVYSGGVGKIGLNRGALSAGSTTITTGAFRMGERGDGARPYTGLIAEMVVFNSALSGTNITNMLDYFKNLYGTP